MREAVGATMLAIIKIPKCKEQDEGKIWKTVRKQ
jgi:hypothetical protein